jgi:riboflavin synthase
MFTGIVETTGTVTAICEAGTNRIFWVQSPISAALSIDQSVSHNGVCLTVEETAENTHRLTAVEETLAKTNLGKWEIGTIVNMERCLQMNGRLDGHIVQGHVDTTATCISITDKNGSWEFSFSIDLSFGHLIIEKGSIAINGTSLTLFNVGKQTFSVAVIPYTYQHTNIQHLKKGDFANIEFDMIGKYVSRFMEHR